MREPAAPVCPPHSALAAPTGPDPADLAALVEKYDMLLGLSAMPASRTSQRRDALRAVAARFPAALREWEAHPPAELRRRRAVVVAAHERGAWPADEPWLPLCLDLHAELRALLKERGSQGHTAQSPSRPAAGLCARAYAAVAARHALTVDAVKASLFSAPRPGATP